MAVLSTLNIATGGLEDAMDARVFDAVHLDAPIWWLHPVFKAAFGNVDAFNHVCKATPITYAAGLNAVLEGAAPPSLEFFRSLPAIVPSQWRKHWAVYVHIYELDGRKPRLYIGSATAEVGAMARFNSYESGRGNLPRFVQRALAQGFEKTHSAALCWSNTPVPGLALKARQRYLGVEGIFQMVFFATIFNNFEPEWIDFVPWCREDVEWEPLCSHVSFSECGKGDFNLSVEDLERLHAAKLAGKRRRKSDKDRRYRIKYKVSRAAKQKAARLAVIASGKHTCNTCQKSYGTGRDLDIHVAGREHKKIVTKIANGASLAEARQPNARSRRMAKLNARSVAQKRFYCTICDHAYKNRDNLDKHYLTKKHRDNAAVKDAELIADDFEDLDSDLSDTESDSDTDMDDVHDGDLED
jgi:hypothetical protein